MASMVNGTGLDRNEARKLVESIARGHGYIPMEMLAVMDAQVRLVVEEALRNKDDMIASSVLTLARNLYTSNARFIFELLQNADDNHYKRAQAANHAPYIAFLVYHDRLVVQCNEDGFTEENIKAICSIGKSSKHGAQGYIGEKGIGFKSTFMAAWKVQIQSGPFSFFFQHREGDSGVGMVTPIWVEPETELSGPLTSISLYFHDNGVAENLQRRRDDIIKQLWDLQGTVLLFLKNLRTIEITVFSQDHQPTWSRRTTMERDALGSSARLYSVEREGEAFRKTIHRFHITTHLAQGLSKNENRTYTEAEETTKAYSTAQVVLAFPLDTSGEPVVELQELFAFMPVRKVGFNFLIHSDFVTQASRQDIVTTSERNIGLRQAIVDAFVKGVQQLCIHPSLQYKWMRYLPREQSLPIDSYWRDLVACLSGALREKPLLRPRQVASKKLYRISELGRLKGAHLDKDGKPLFPDLPVEKYLSDAYDPEDLDILGEYGLQHLRMEDIMPRMQDYVRQSQWMQKMYQDRCEDWHSRVARLMMLAWEHRRYDWRAQLKRMPLLPLRSATLQSATSDDTMVFFPEIDSIPIPQDISLPVILPAAAANLDCRKLYKTLGVTEAKPQRVRQLIMEKNYFWRESRLNVAQSCSHFRYLYQMYPRDRLHSEEQSSIIVFDHKERAKWPKKEFVYLPGEGEWSPATLLQTPQSSDQIADFEELDASFVHPAYLQDAPQPPPGYAETWTNWLFLTAWVEVKVQIFTVREHVIDKAKTFSKEWLYVTKHWPGKLITRFHQHWQIPESRKCWEVDEVGTKLAREVELLCTDGARHALQTTFLPMPPLLARCESLLADVNAIPFLKLERLLQDSDVHEWANFGKYFHIGVFDDLNFSLAILRTIASGGSKTKGPLAQTVHQLYSRIHVQCLASEDREGEQEKVREIFGEETLIYAPVDQPKQWFKVSECIWSGEGAIVGKACLEPLYSDLAGLFVDCLRVPRLSLALIYQELLDIGNTNPIIHYVKNLLWSLQALLPAETGARPVFADELASRPIFPVRMPDGSSKYLTALDDFAIIDRQHYADALKNSIKFLGFTLDEVRRLRPLIEWAGLTDRYLSRSVVEQTVVDDDLCIENRHRTRDLGRKASAFVSIAAYFDSPHVSRGPEIMHFTLRKTKVFNTERIASTLIVAQDGKEIVMPIGNSELHIQATDAGVFEIYVPAEESAQDFCIASSLPREFASRLLKCKPSKVNPQVVSIVASIIHGKPSSTDRILEANGIVKLDLPQYDDDDFEVDEPNPNQAKRARSGAASTTPTRTLNRPVSGGRSPFGAAIDFTGSPSLFEQTRDEQYRILLVQVAKVARGMPFPGHNPIFDMPAILQKLQGNAAGQKSFGFPISDQAEWQRMVGAAGELFVFELLSALSPRLPNFGFPNWQSTVRRFVKAHPDYSTLEPWDGAEISDLFYSDDAGALTAVFIEKGYLNETWRGERLDYFIEVKTTMSNNFATPFYLSKYQYTRMQNLSRGGAHALNQRKKMYALFRVYGLESGIVGLKVYLDPEAARKAGLLEFEADPWTVTPRAWTQMQPRPAVVGDLGVPGPSGPSGRAAADQNLGGPAVPVFGKPWGA